MLRLVIQVSMLLAIPLMAVCLYGKPDLAPWYISYVVLFNMLVGPVFSAGSVTSERERQTLDLLLTTIISPWQILWGKLISGLRVSSVLTSFLLWPLLLACVMVPYYWTQFAVGGGVSRRGADVLHDHGHGGAVLLGAVPQNGAQFDDDVHGHHRAVLPAAGDAIFRRHFFPERQSHADW